ncbi:DNA topoisomerase III [Brevibacillus invocatus]|uniref:DNA topoisomerase III n=1 Tax=Brevibacillus invocatus TaxID=173959 RepID=UPI00203D6A63|nr:DNA topoisomerase III [Brevibacillus invocatus]MCM3077744.1 DNA topoisomerase III [Brevibacillus invocatus]MCM3428745.1 DNA topoisomerase III [Brevibacillus invocatus]
MSKTLVLAEKPSVGRDIARVLQCQKKGNGYFEGDTYIVTWALGHLVTLADPEVYGQQFSSWKIEDLPIMPSPLKLVIIKESQRQFHTVKQQMKRNDVKEIVIATDAGREGELVARWIIEMAHVSKPIRRLWISSVTDKAIREGFRNLKDGKAYEKLYASAAARAEADWLVGINATRALTCKHNAQLSCGRVQTPTLAIVANREEEIRQFKPKPYYGLTAVAEGPVQLQWQDQQTKDVKTFSQEKADQLLASLKQEKSAEVIEVTKAHKKSFAPQLYDLTELQRDANKMFGYSAKETLSVMQGLYEHHKVVTYPRTDSRYLSADIVETLPDRIKAVQMKPYAPLAAKVLRAPIKASKAFVDDSKVSDHHAIIPTEQTVLLSDLSDKERRIFDLVVKRFLAVLFPAFEYEQTTIQAKIGKELFVARGKTVLSQGWREVYDYDVEDEDSKSGVAEQTLPKLTKGDRLRIQAISQTKGETKPPEPFTEASLLSAMENPAKYMANESKELIKTIGETGGLGTVATRADVIEKLFNSFLFEKRGKHIYVTAKGKQLLELVPDDMQSPTLTAQWEQKLGAIATGSLNKQVFIGDIKAYAKTVVQEIKNSEKTFRHDNLTRSKCPECSKLLLEVNGKRGKMLVCQDRECGYRKNIAKTTNARCPKCHKRLELQGQGEGQTFVCACGHREKLTTFQERRDKEKGSKVSKKEVAKYLKSQEKDTDEGMNTALKDALAKFKFDK